MNLAKRILVEKRIAVTTVCATALMAIALQTFFVYPLNARVEYTHKRRVEAARGLASAARSLDAIRAAADDQMQANAKLQRFYHEILPRGLVGARGITSPTLASLAQRHNLLLRRRSSVSERDEDTRLARLRTTMLLAGDWQNIRRFIQELEASPEFIVIENIVLAQNNEDIDSSLVLTLALATYYQAEDAT